MSKTRKGYHKCRDWEYRESMYCNNRACPEGREPGTCLIKDRPKREIIQPKPKMVKVKAMAAINNDGVAYAFLKAGDSDYWNKGVWKPCTITIEAKWLKGGR